jgi:hypothetical protein
VEHVPLAKQTHADARPFSLTDFCSQFDEQRFNVTPSDVSADGARKDQFKRSGMLAFHGWNGTE